MARIKIIGEDEAEGNHFDFGFGISDFGFVFRQVMSIQSSPAN